MNKIVRMILSFNHIKSIILLFGLFLMNGYAIAQAPAWTGTPVFVENFGGTSSSTDPAWLLPGTTELSSWTTAHPGISTITYGTAVDGETSQQYGLAALNVDNMQYAVTKMIYESGTDFSSDRRNVDVGGADVRNPTYDHTTGNGNGYYVGINPVGLDNEIIYLKTLTVDPGATYSFTAWLMNLRQWGGFSTPLTFQVTGNGLNQSQSYAISEGNWAQYGFDFLVPATTTSITISITVNTIDEPAGWKHSFAMDDITISKFVPYVTITSPESPYYYCEDWHWMEMEVAYAVLGGGAYKWQYSATGLNDSWSDISGATDTLKNSEGTFKRGASYPLSSGAGYYRVLVTQNPDDYTNAMTSNVMQVKVRESIDPNKMIFTQSSAVSGTNIINPNDNFTLTVAYEESLNNPVYKWQKNVEDSWSTVSNTTGLQIPAVGNNVPASGTVTSPIPAYRVYISSDDFCENFASPVVTITNNRISENFKNGTSDFIATDSVKNTYAISGLQYSGYNGIDRDSYIFTKTPAPYWGDTPEIYDHTGNNGYFLQVYKGGSDVEYDANANPIAFYETTIDGVCGNSEYSFTAWTANLRPSYNNYELNFKVTFFDASGTEVSSAKTYKTDAVAASEWVQYGFNLSIPAGATKAVFTIESTGNLWGSNLLTMFALDDVEIRLITPVRITVPSISSVGVPEGGTTELEGDYFAEYDCETMEEPLSYQWQISTNDINWTDIANATTVKYITDPISSAVYFRLMVTDNTGKQLVSDAVQVVPFSLSAKIYYVCPDNITQGEVNENGYTPSLIRLSMPEAVAVGYNWYETETEETPMANLDYYNNDRSALLPDGNTATISVRNENSSEGVFVDRTYWVEPYDISTGKKLMDERIPVDLKQSFVCGSLDAVVSPTAYKRLYNEDFGFGDSNVSTTPVQGMDYTQVTDEDGSINAGHYKVLKTSETSNTGWYTGITDHVYDVPDAEHGYMVQVDAAKALSQFYTHTLTGLDYCTDVQLVFSAWITSPMNWRGTDKACLVFILRKPDTGEILSEFYTGNLIDADEGRWRQFAFRFPVPDGLGSVELIVKNNTAGDASGNDFILDDIEAYLYIPAVKILPAVNGSVCNADYGVFLEGDYEDDGTLGKNLDYRWEYRATENDQWNALTGEGWESGVKSVTNGSITRGDSRFQIETFTASNNGQYRLVVGQKGAFDQIPVRYECIGISEIRDLVWVNSVPPAPELISDKTSVCLADGTISVTNTDAAFADYEKYVWTVDGTIIPDNNAAGITVPLTTSGYHTINLVAYNDTGCSTAATHEYIVFPETTIWTAEGETGNWNDRYNWSNGIPGECTDIIIPNDGISISGTTLLPHYPVLEDADIETLNDVDYATNQANLIALRKGESQLRASCDTITFKMGSKVSRTDRLSYTFAKVDVDLLPNRWYTLSAPLAAMYSGDYLAEGSVKRKLPTTYMMKYNSTNPQTGFSPEKEAGDFSKPFNSVKEELYGGLGYAVWLDDGNDIGANVALQSYRFPKDSTHYTMWDKYGNYSSTVALPERQQVGRFAYEKYIIMGNKLPREGVTGFELTISQDKDTYTTTLVGNPFMSHLNFTRFAEVNQIEGGYYIWTGETYDANMPGIFNDNADIAPMQSFIIEKSGGKEISFTFEFDMVSSTATSPIRRSAPAFAANPVLRMEVLRDDVAQSNIRLKYDPTKDNEYDVQKDMWTLFSLENTEPAVLYALLDEKAASIRTLGDLTAPVELGIRTTQKGLLTVRMSGLESLDSSYDVYLEDKITGITQNLRKNQEYTFDNQTGNVEGRLFLVFIRNSIVTFTVEDQAGNAIEDATIIFDDQTLYSYTITPVYAGTYNYSVSKNGYITKDGNITVANNDETIDIVLQTTISGTEQNSGNNVTLYPNPFNDFINISSDINIKSVSIENILGQRLNVIQSAANSTISTVSVPSGIYFVTLEDVNGNKTVIKMLKK